MKEGTIINSIYITRESLSLNSNIISCLTGDGKVEMLIDKDDRISITILEGNTILHTFISQQILFKNDGEIFIVIMWNEYGITLSIENKNIENSLNFNNITISPRLTNANYSIVYNKKNVTEKCKKWMDWRNIYYSTPQQTTSNGKILKNENEQIQELSDSIMALKDAYTEVFLKNKNHQLVTIYPLLRTLLYWKENSEKTYKPLLIRIAGFEKIPLPVYAIPSNLDETEKFKDDSFGSNIISSLSTHIVVLMAYTYIKDQRCEIMDLQEWLIQPIISNKDIEKRYTIKDLFFDSANSWGSHNDETIPFILNQAKNTKLSTDNLIFELIRNITEITIQSGEYILDRIRKKTSM